TDAGLQIGKVPVAFGETPEQSGVEGQSGVRCDGIETILFVNRLPEDNPPVRLTLLEEIIEASRANHVAKDAVDLGALIDRHFRLRDGTGTGNVDRRATEEMKDAHALLETGAADG